MNEKELRFDELLSQLEAVVARLENDKTDLEASLTLYEEGMRLVKACSKKLDEAEQRVELVQSDVEGNVTTAPFSAEGQA